MIFILKFSISCYSFYLMFGSGLKQLEKKMGHAVEVSNIIFCGGRVDLNDHF